MQPNCGRDNEYAWAKNEIWPLSGNHGSRSYTATASQWQGISWQSAVTRQQCRQCTPDGSLEIRVVNGAFTSLNGEFYFDLLTRVWGCLTAPHFLFSSLPSWKTTTITTLATTPLPIFLQNPSRAFWRSLPNSFRILHLQGMFLWITNKLPPPPTRPPTYLDTLFRSLRCAVLLWAAAWQPSLSLTYLFY